LIRFVLVKQLNCVQDCHWRIYFRRGLQAPCPYYFTSLIFGFRIQRARNVLFQILQMQVKDSLTTLINNVNKIILLRLRKAQTEIECGIMPTSDTSMTKHI
jgi:hypothetical protein